MSRATTQGQRASAARDAAGWRPMAFGHRPARSIRNPVMEPLWPGRRVLVHVAADPEPGPGRSSIGIRDEAGLELAGHPDLQSALLAAARVSELILDGYLLPLPPLDAVLAVVRAGPEVPGVGTTARHLFLGSRSMGSRARDARGTATPAVLAGSHTDPALGALTFVAIDLLALDGQALLDVPLQERKRLLDGVLAAGELVRHSPQVRLPASNWHRQWRALGFREMAVKDANSRYLPGAPSPDWSIAPIPTH